MIINLADALGRLSPDPLRAGRRFSADIADASESLYRAGSDEERSSILGAWLERHQP
jgi:hypothetical protein